MDSGHSSDECGDDDIAVVNEEDIAEVIVCAENNIEDDEDEDDMDVHVHDDGAITDEIRDDSILCFKQHSDSVFTSRFSPSGQLVVSGGEDDLAYVWSVSDGSVLFKCDGHKDSVTCVSFNHDNSYVATADMSGLVKVWQLSTQSQIWSFDVSDIEWMMWHPLSNVLLVGTIEGDLWMWKIPGGDCKTFSSHGSKTTCARITPDGVKICVGYEDGSVRVWDLKNQTVIHKFSGRTGHSKEVTCVDTQLTDSSLFASGSADGTVNLCSYVTGKLLSTFTADKPQQQQQEEEGEGDNSVEAVAFCKVAPLLAFGSLNNRLYIYDIPSQTLRHTCHHDDGPVQVCWLPDSALLYTACLDGCVRMWDARNGQCQHIVSGHTDMILDMDVTGDGKLIVTSSRDSTARIFTINS